MITKKFIFVFIGIFLLAFASSLDSLGTFKQGDTIRIAQVCSDATYINITSISYPNSTIAVAGQEMILSNGEYYLDFNLTDTLGRYDVRGISDGCEGEFATYFEINPTGKELTISKSILYIFLLIFSIFSFIGILIFSIKIPSNNYKDQMTGYILALNNLKYLKYTLYGLSYIFLIWISYFVWMLSYAYLDFNFLSEILRFVFYIIAILTLPLFILFLFITISNLIRDTKLSDMLSRGLKAR